MTKSKLIILAWLLLLIPTCLLGIGALRLLQSEEARLAASDRATSSDRVDAIAGNIDLAIAEVQEGLQETLRRLPQQLLGEQLDSWKRSNPLIRNGFIWRRGRGLVFPDPEHPASDEEALFVRRYLTLFADQSGWEPQSEQETPQPAKPVATVFAERKELRQLAKQPPVAAESSADAFSSAVTGAAAPAPSAVAEQQALSGRSGWRSWYADDQLHLLGWFAPQGSQTRYGIEIEMMALLSRLLVNLPATPPTAESYQLIDGNGRRVHQTGSFEATDEMQPLAVAAIGSLPHWQVALSRQDSAAGSGGILLIGSLLIGTFIIAILLGGSLLLWQAWRNQRDARQKTSFVANISHELKTPLTTIRMYAEMLDEGSVTKPEQQSRYLQTIVRESQRLSRLVGNVLDFSRLEQGRKEYASEEIDLTRWLPPLIEAQQVRLTESDMQLQLQIEPLSALVRSDRDALEQIVLNLVDNAIKYAADGQQLMITLQETSGSYQLEVADRGPGIPAAHRERIFAKFHRIDNSLTTRRQGSGLGLSIARQLARDLGGELTCQAVASGASFILTLPRRNAA
jgi:signal transduction histidine kinase